MNNENKGEFIWTDELIKKMIYERLPINERYFGNLQKCLDEFKEQEKAINEQ